MTSEDRLFSMFWAMVAITLVVGFVFISKCTIDKNAHLEKVKIKAIENNCLYLKAQSGHHIICGFKLKESSKN